jgi:ABC-type phosphate transport system substrate-binding protein
MKRLIISLIVIAALAMTSSVVGAAEPEFKVVVNTANNTASISKTQLSRCFMKQTNTWINGQAVMPVDQSPASPVRAAFSAAIHDRDVNAVKSFWQRQIFSGRGVPPPEKASDSEVLAFVRANPGGIGYVSAGAQIGENVKILQVTEK